MRIPDKITSDNFYFYRGYIIRLYNSGAYLLYSTHIIGGLSNMNEQDRLQYCMKTIDKLNKERDDKELKEQELKKFAKLISPQLDTIVKEIIKDVSKYKLI